MKNTTKFDWFAQGYYDWTIKNWNPPINSRHLKLYCMGWDYIWGENAEELYDYFGFID